MSTPRWLSLSFTHNLSPQRATSCCCHWSRCSLCGCCCQSLLPIQRCLHCLPSLNHVWYIALSVADIGLLNRAHRTLFRKLSWIFLCVATLNTLWGDHNNDNNHLAAYYNKTLVVKANMELLLAKDTNAIIIKDHQWLLCNADKPNLLILHDGQK